MEIRRKAIREVRRWGVGAAGGEGFLGQDLRVYGAWQG